MLYYCKLLRQNECCLHLGAFTVKASVIFAASRCQSHCFPKSISSCQYIVTYYYYYYYRHIHFGSFWYQQFNVRQLCLRFLAESAENWPKIRRIMSRRKSAEKNFCRPNSPKIRRKLRPAGRNSQKNSAEGSMVK